LAMGFVQQGESFDWRRLNVRHQACEQEIVRRNFTNDAVSREQREQAVDARKHFESAYRRAADAVRSQFDGDSRQSREKFITSFKAGNGPTWGIGKGLFERATKGECSDEQVRTFYDVCPPFRALLVSLAVAEYERCVRDFNNRERSMKAGRFDLFMATYLPYCSQFITADRRQFNCLGFVAAQSQLSTSVLSFEDLKEKLLGLPSKKQHQATTKG
jgi:hypothetical protein